MGSSVGNNAPARPDASGPISSVVLFRGSRTLLSAGEKRNMREFADGQLVPGARYRVLKLLGEGGMGSVYEVEHVELGKRFVLKALFRELAGRRDLVARLRTEWRALGRLDHPNIINVTDAGTSDNGVHFYVMERAEGETLADRLRRVGRLSIRDALPIASAVSEGLGAAHDIGIVHRDIKPPNIYLLRGGGVKLLDFGIAKLLDSSVEVITARGMAIGTPRYMSPEQARGDSVDGRADLYAVGLLIYEMLTGTGPFDDSADPPEMLLAHLTHQPPRISARVPEVGSELDDLVQSLLRKVPSERPASACQVAAILRGLGKRWQTVSTAAPTPAAHYHAATKENASPKLAPSAAKTAPLPSASQPTDVLPQPDAGRSELENAHTTPAQVTPSGSGSTLIIRPSGEVTASVETVRDSHSPFSVDQASATTAGRVADGESAMSASATTPGEPAMHEPLPSPPSVDRTLAEATSPHDGAPKSERERTQEFGDLDSPSPVGNSELPTRTSVPLATMASADNAETPPPVEMMQASSAGRSARRWLSLLAAAALLSICGVVLAVVFFARADAPEASAPADEAASSPAAAAQGPEPATTPTPAEPATSAAKPAPKPEPEPAAAPPVAKAEPASPPAKPRTKPVSDEHKAAKSLKSQEKKPRPSPAPAAAPKKPPEAVLPSSGL